MTLVLALFLYGSFLGAAILLIVEGVKEWRHK